MRISYIEECQTSVSTFTSTYNRCLSEGVFLAIPKEAEMFAVLKLALTEVSAKSYRQICLLNVMGKVLESLILHRLKSAIGQLEGDQFVGRKGQGTTDAINQVMTATLIISGSVWRN